MKDYRIFNLRSKELNPNGTPKLPNEDRLEFGEIAINYKDGNEVFIIKNSRNELVQFESINNDNLINMDRRFKLEKGFYTSDEAHRAIPDDMKKIGLILFYKISDNKIVFEQFVGTNIDDWLFPEFWKPVNGIIDNLGSTSVDDALSANQGRVLNNKFTFLDHTLLPLEISTWVTPSGLSERGQAIDVTFNWSISRKGYTSDQVPMLEVYVNGTKLTKPSPYIKYKLSDDKTIHVKVISVEGLNIETDIKKDFTEVIYGGLIDDNFVIDKNSILQYRINDSSNNPVLITSKSYDKFLGKVDKKVAFYAYPKDRGGLTKVIDGNGFNITDLYSKKGGGWNVETLNMIVDGKTTPYYVYKSELFYTTGEVTHKYR